MKKITPEILREWGPCKDGYKRFIELLPEGGTLSECIEALVSDGHDSWGYWIFDKCREDELFQDQTINGYQNSGYRNSGYRNSGNLNSGDWNSGDWNSGDWNSGDWNSGNLNSGYRNSGNRNSGNRNSGNRNSGNRNSGDWNSGNLNSGDWNSGNLNSGNLNSGDWNSGNLNSGFFNTTTPQKINVFNRECDYSDWQKADKPRFIYEIELIKFISEENMTDEEKSLNKNYPVIGGFVKNFTYEEAWANAWKEASEKDKELLRLLPNFDAGVFKEITGIDVNKGDDNDK